MSAGRFAHGPGGAVTGTGTGTRRAQESTTSFDDSRSHEDSFVGGGRQGQGRAGGKVRDAGGEVTTSSRDATRDTSFNSQGGGGGGEGRGHYYVSRKKEEEAGGGGGGGWKSSSRVEADSSSTTEDTDGRHHGSYDFRYPAYDEKVKWSCEETGGWQKLSFLFLVLAFIGHAVAVCTPYWVVSYLGDQMSLYEGVWLSCYREGGVGRWVCSNYDTIRGLFEQPPWYEASQSCAVMSLILLMPALMAASLYSYVVALSGRSRASWVLVCFLGASALCAFLSFVVFGAGYPLDQKSPPGNARLHASFGLQIVSFLFGCLSLATHLKDSHATLRTWDNNEEKNRAVRPLASASDGSAAPSRGPYVTSGRVSDVKADPPRHKSHVPKLPSFSMPKFPSALSRFRSSGGRGGGGGGEKSPTAPPPAPPPASGWGSPDDVGRKATTRERVQSGAPSQRGGAVAAAASARGSGGNVPTYKSYAPSSGGDSVSGYDSVV